MTHETFREMLPLYVIDALDGGELRAFEQYVAGNRARCETEIAEFQSIANKLAMAVPPVEPPARVFERIMAEVAEKKPTARQESSAWITWIPWAFAAAASVALVLSVLAARSERSEFSAQLAKRDRTLQAQANQFQAKIEVLLAQKERLDTEKAALIKAVDELHQQVDRQDLNMVSLQRDFERQRATLDLVMDPSIRVAQLADPAGKTKATARAYWQETQKTGLIVVSNVSPVLQGDNKRLELWAICGDQPPVPAGLFWTDKAGHGVGEIKLTKQVACAPKFAVSIEPAGGVDAPTGPIVLLGQ